jgi:hypothetical protein
MLGWHETVMVRASCRKVLLRDSDTVLGTHRVPTGPYCAMTSPP